MIQNTKAPGILSFAFALPALAMLSACSGHGTALFDGDGGLDGASASPTPGAASSTPTFGGGTPQGGNSETPTRDAGAQGSPTTGSGCKLAVQVSANPSCNSCVEKSCCVQVNQCAASADCAAFDQCLTDCESVDPSEQQACAQTCMGQHSSSVPIWQAVAQCAKGTCLSVCQG
jgi:hypothetical protein